MEEIWKPIAGCEGRYEVSSLGRVKSLAREVNNNGGIKYLREKILSPAFDSFGYPAVGIRNGTKNSCRTRIHRLVAETFIPNPENKREVNHIDNNPTNNSLSNLEWATHYENMRHATNQDRLNHGENNPSSKLTEKDVLFIRKSKLKPKELTRMFKLSENHIYMILNRKCWEYL